MKQDLSKIKVGYYIYDISTNIAGFQVNQYKVLYIDNTYIYCVNNKGVKGRFKKSDDAIYTNINTAKEVAHRMFQDKLKKEKAAKEKQRRDAKLESLKIAFYNNLNKSDRKRIFNYYETDLESRVRNEQIQKIKENSKEHTYKPRTGIVKHETIYVGDGYERNWRYDSPKLLPIKRKKIRPSVPYKILPGGAIVAVGKKDKD